MRVYSKVNWLPLPMRWAAFMIAAVDDNEAERTGPMDVRKSLGTFIAETGIVQ